MRKSRRWTLEEAQKLRARQPFMIFDEASTVPVGVWNALDPLLPAQQAAAIEYRVAHRTQAALAERNKLTAYLEQQLTLAGIRHLFVTEHRFDDERRFRLDFYCDAYKLGVEVHGGVHTSGRHNTGTGFESDRTKMNLAAERGITVLEFTGKPIKSGEAFCQLVRVMEQRGWKAA